MAKLQNIQLIFSEEKRKGDGKEDPIRIVQQWFLPDGTLVLEYDPHLDDVSMTGNLITHLRGLD